MGLEPAGDTFDRRRRNDKDPSRPEHRHTDGVARCIQHKTALVAVAQSNVELDPGVDFAATKAAPATTHQRHRTERCRRYAMLRGNDHRERTEHWDPRRKFGRRDILGAIVVVEP